MVQKRDLSAEKIIQTATDLIKADGADAATFGNIAKALNCRTQALYFYFKNHNDLLLGVATNFFATLNHEVQTACFDLNGREALIKMATTIRNYGRQNLDLSLAVMRTSGLPDHLSAFNETRHLSEMMQRYIGDFVSDPVQQLSISRGVRAMIIGEVVSESVGWFTNPAIDRDDSFVDNLMRLFDESQK